MNNFNLAEGGWLDTWSRISRLLEGTSVDEPREMDLILPSVDRNSCGLSDAEKLNIDKVYMDKDTGMMWYHFESTDERWWHNMSRLSTEDLKAILDELSS